MHFSAAGFREHLLLIVLSFAFLVASTMGADWSPWVEGVFGILALLLIVFSREGRIIGADWRAPERWFALLLGLMLLCAIWSTNLYATLRGWTYFALGFVVFQATLRVPQKQKQLLGIFIFFIATAGGLYAVVQQIVQGLPRAEGFLGNANAFGAYLGLLSPVGIGLALQAKGRLRALLWSGVCIVTIAFFRTFSLTTFVGLGIALIFAYPLLVHIKVWSRIQTRKLFGYGIGVLVLIAAVAVVLRTIDTGNLQEGLRFDKVITAEHFSSSFQQRWRFLETTTRMVAERPLAGFGLGSYQGTYPRYASTLFELPRYAHNAYFELAAESGIVAAIFLICLLYTLLRRAALFFQELIGKAQPWFFVALLGSVAAAIFDFGWHFPAVWIGLWAIAGICCTPSTLKEKDEAGKVEFFLKPVFFLFGVFLFLRGVTVAFSYTPFQRGESLMLQGRPSEAAVQYQLGTRFDPNPYFFARRALALWMDAKGDKVKLLEAQELISKVLHWNAYDYFAYQLQGRIAFAQKDYSAADDAFRQAITLDHNFHPDIHYEYANQLYTQNRNAEAMQVMNAILAAYAENSWTANPYLNRDLEAIKKLQMLVQRAEP